MSDLAEAVKQYRQYCPDNKTNEEILALIQQMNGDEVAIQRSIAVWWEDYSKLEMSDWTPPPKSPKKDEKRKSPNPADLQNNVYASQNSSFESPKKKEEKPAVRKLSSGNQASSIDSGYGASGNQERSATNVRKTSDDSKRGRDRPEKKEAQGVERKPSSSEMESIGSQKYGAQNRYSTPPTTLNSQGSDHENDEEDRKRDREDREARSTRRASSSRQRSRSSRKSTRVGRTHITSQVRLLAEHCFTLSDDAIASLVKYRIPSQSRWDFKEKIQKRDELIKHLQEALYVLSQEKQRFQTACADIEMCLQEENQELRNHLATVSSEGGDPFEMNQLKEEIANMKAKVKTKEDENSLLIRSKLENETKISELSTEIMRSQFERKEDGKNNLRFEQDIQRLHDELKNCKVALETKNQELSMALKSFGELQRVNEEREQALRAARKDAEDRANKLEEDRSNLQDQLNAQNADAAFLFSELAALKEALHSTREELKKKIDVEEDSRFRAQQVREALIVERELRGRAELKEEEERRERIAACSQLLAMKSHNNELLTKAMVVDKAHMEEMTKKLETIEKQKMELEVKNANLEERLAVLQAEANSLKQTLAVAQDDRKNVEKIMSLTGELEKTRHRLEELQTARSKDGLSTREEINRLLEIIDEKENKIQEAEQERRRLHNIIQELRGNVRVFARCRPFLPGEGTDREVDPNGNLLESYCSPTSTIDVGVDGLAVTIRKKAEGQVTDAHTFAYDKSFPPSVGQEEVFNEVSEFVQSALDGYSVCLFSYGQTGSGKTHTMQGSGTGPMRGIIPRAMEQVGSYCTKLRKQGWEFQMQVTFLEIYNEHLVDLLLDDNEEAVELEIKHDKKGKTFVQGIRYVPVDPNDTELIENLMATASKHRSVASTAKNEHSSRSHSVFSLHLTGKNASKGFQLEGQLNLCDLAGSERLQKSKAEGARLTETKAINKSLSCLIDVFHAISNGHSHIPFRNSKLTFLLQPSLSGDGKTCMMVNVSPGESDYYESLSSLRFAQQVNACELGKASKNVSQIENEDGEGDEFNEISKNDMPSTIARRPSTIQKRDSTVKNSPAAKLQRFGKK